MTSTGQQNVIARQQAAATSTATSSAAASEHCFSLCRHTPIFEHCALSPWLFLQYSHSLTHSLDELSSAPWKQTWNRICSRLLGVVETLIRSLFRPLSLARASVANLAGFKRQIWLFFKSLRKYCLAFLAINLCLDLIWLLLEILKFWQHCWSPATPTGRHCFAALYSSSSSRRAATAALITCCCCSLSFAFAGTTRSGSALIRTDVHKRR